MSIKDLMFKFKSKNIEGVKKEDNSNIDLVNTSINLDDKVDEFIKWYYENMVKGNYTDVGEYNSLKKIRNLIEKIAVWYELRYPDYEINRLIPSIGQERININEVMFRNNPYVNEMIDENSDLKKLDWDEFYNASVFIKSLPFKERYIFQKPRYRNLVYVKPNITFNNPVEVMHKSARLHLTSRGFVESAEGFDSYSNFKITNIQLKGMHVKDVVKLLKEKGVLLPRENELEETIKDVEKWNYQKEQMLNCIMYRIIERGGNRIGPRRAFLFAKEFGRNIDIPMMYGVDYQDPWLRIFINEYIKAGGSTDLLCYVGYFSRACKSEKMDTVSVQEMLKSFSNDCNVKYTPEETALHQRMVNALASQVDQDKVKKEEVKQLRLQRKLKKSRNNFKIND